MKKVARIAAQQKGRGVMHHGGIIEIVKHRLMLQLASTMNSGIQAIILEQVAEIKASMGENETKLHVIEMNHD